MSVSCQPHYKGKHLFCYSALRAFEQRPAPRRIGTTRYIFPIVPTIHVIVAKLFREIACRRWFTIAAHCEWRINFAASWANPSFFYLLSLLRLSTPAVSIVHRIVHQSVTNRFMYGWTASISLIAVTSIHLCATVGAVILLSSIWLRI